LGISGRGGLTQFWNHAAASERKVALHTTIYERKRICAAGGEVGGAATVGGDEGRAGPCPSVEEEGQPSP
jgi:hypothetical protein